MLLATTTVESVDRFLEVFGTTGADKRAVHGSKGSTVFRDPTEENRVCPVRVGRTGLAGLRVRPRGSADPQGGRSPRQAPVRSAARHVPGVGEADR